MGLLSPTVFLNPSNIFLPSMKTEHFFLSASPSWTLLAFLWTQPLYKRHIPTSDSLASIWEQGFFVWFFVGLPHCVKASLSYKARFAPEMTRWGETSQSHVAICQTVRLADDLLCLSRSSLSKPGHICCVHSVQHIWQVFGSTGSL